MRGCCRNRGGAVAASGDTSEALGQVLEALCFGRWERLLVRQTAVLVLGLSQLDSFSSAAVDVVRGSKVRILPKRGVPGGLSHPAACGNAQNSFGAQGVTKDNGEITTGRLRPDVNDSADAHFAGVL